MRMAANHTEGPVFSWTLPGQAIPTVLYYFVEARWPQGGVERLPGSGIEQPGIHFISDAHLADLDRHDDLLDVFDLVRMARSVAWKEGGGVQATETDLRRAAGVLLRSHAGRVEEGDVIATFRADDRQAVITFVDASRLTVPRTSTGRISDVVAEGGYAGRLPSAALPFWAVAHPVPPVTPDACRPLRSLAVNRAFYLAEPDAMRRYTALAWDNIRHTPGAFLKSAVYRAWRLFVVQGTDDSSTAYQFRYSGLVYKAATIVSLTFLVLFLCGVALAIRQRRRLLVIGAPILYVPVTIAWVLTNMRYTVTVQPLVFAFIAVALLAAADRRRS
jgi:hypothetical protein